ncbi:MAG: hypothetical protein AAFW46_12225 [Pseudomonadota bacterium]
MRITRVAAALVATVIVAGPALGQQNGRDNYPGFGAGFDTGDLAPGYELPGEYPETPEREQVTPFGEEPQAQSGQQDAPINVIGGQTETFERGIIGDALNRGKSSVFESFKRTETGAPQ